MDVRLHCHTFCESKSFSGVPCACFVFFFPFVIIFFLLFILTRTVCEVSRYVESYEKDTNICHLFLLVNITEQFIMLC